MFKKKTPGVVGSVSRIVCCSISIDASYATVVYLALSVKCSHVHCE